MSVFPELTCLTKTPTVALRFPLFSLAEKIDVRWQRRYVRYVL